MSVTRYDGGMSSRCSRRAPTCGRRAVAGRGPRGARLARMERLRPEGDVGVDDHVEPVDDDAPDSPHGVEGPRVALRDEEVVDDVLADDPEAVVSLRDAVADE